MNKFCAGWYVIYTKPRHEKKVIDGLSRLNILSFLPTVKTLRNWADRKRYVDLPIFPSYVFVKLEDLQSYFRSIEINGILHYVRSGKEIAMVSESMIYNIRLMISNELLNIEVCSSRFLPGRKLFIKEGPFTGFCCEVIQHKSRQKIIVRIELLNRNILLDMPAECLMPDLRPGRERA